VREHGISGDDLALQSQHAQQFQRGLMFVGLGIHPKLGQDRLDVRGIGGEQVDPGRRAVATAPGGLAVDGDVRGVVPPEASPEPLAQSRLEIGDVEAAEDPRIGGLTEAPTGGEPEVLEERPPPFLAVLNDRLIRSHAREHGDDGQAEQGGKRVPLALGPSWIMNFLKQFHQRGVGFHARLLIRRPRDVIDHSGWI
jgi:hypothetical protein